MVGRAPCVPLMDSMSGLEYNGGGACGRVRGVGTPLGAMRLPLFAVSRVQTSDGFCGFVRDGACQPRLHLVPALWCRRVVSRACCRFWVPVRILRPGPQELIGVSDSTSQRP